MKAKKPAPLLTLVRLYVAMYARAPDATALAYWRHELTLGTTIATAATILYSRDEARALFPQGFARGAIAVALHLSVLGPAHEFSSESLDSLCKAIADRGAGPAFVEFVTRHGDNEYFTRRVERARRYAEEGGDIAGATAALNEPA
jgi:hypothetical protein